MAKAIQRVDDYILKLELSKEEAEWLLFLVDFVHQATTSRPNNTLKSVLRAGGVAFRLTEEWKKALDHAVAQHQSEDDSISTSTPD
jgi:hypothetical protein